MAKFILSEIQAKAILVMQLQRITGLEVDKLKDEYAELKKNIQEYNAILASHEKKLEIIVAEFKEVKEKYADPRRTEITLSEELDIEDEDLIPVEDVIITITKKGYIKRMTVDTYKAQNRGGKGVTGAKMVEEDYIERVLYTSSHDTLLFFSNLGKMYRLRGFEIPEAGRTAKGTAIVNLLNLDAGEKISAIIPIQNYADGKYILMSTKSGLIKKTPLKEYDSARKTGLLGITLKEDDELIDVRLTDGEDNVVLVTKKGLSITFDEKDVRPVGRVAQGVIGMRLDKDDCVIGMEPIIVGSKATLLAITENGFGKSTLAAFIRVMLYGFSGESKRSELENERKRFGRYYSGVFQRRTGSLYDSQTNSRITRPVSGYG